jgi:drug/metabolite transporter (DMT)-like permease
MPLPSSTKADLLLLLVTLLAAISWMFSKEAVMLMPPLLFMGIRFLLASLLLALFAWRQLQRLDGEQYWRGARVGVVFGLAMCFWVSGLNVASNIGEGAFLASLAVILVPVIARIVFKERQPSSTWLALPVAVAGLAMLSLQHGFRLEAGQGFFVAAAVIFALHYTLNTRAANARLIHSRDGATRELMRIPVMALTTISLACAGAVALSASLLLEPWHATFESFSPVLAGWILASVLIGTSTRFAVQTWAQSLSSSNNGVVILVLEPVWVASISAFWFDERMSGSQMAGCALIFAALLINRWSTVRRLLTRSRASL